MPGTAADNAAMELFFALLQNNVLNTRRWGARSELRIVIWIERTHHRRRRQGCSADEYETIMAAQTALAAWTNLSPEPAAVASNLTRGFR